MSIIDFFNKVHESRPRVHLCASNRTMGGGVDIFPFSVLGFFSLNCKKVDVISMFVARKFCDLTSLIVSVARHEVNGMQTITST